MSKVLFYRCNVCGNMVALIKKGGGILTCCDQEMEKLEPDTTNAAREKHVPVVIKEDDLIRVSVGSVAHPMLAEHFIEWIALDNGEKTEFVYLKPGMEPKAEFQKAGSGTVYAYCNLHGLWKAEI